MKCCDPNVNIIAISDAGKLIFHRNEDDSEEYLCYICGLIQAIRFTTLNDADLDFGEIEYIDANNSQILFMTVGCITMVAIAQKNSGRNRATLTTQYSEAFLKLQLEYVYTGIIFTLTDSVQYMLAEDANLDVREMLGSASNLVRGVLNGVNCNEYQPCMYLGGVDVFGPVPSDIRNHTTTVLTTICSKRKPIIYAILSIGKKLFTIIQPDNKHHQLQSFDLNLLLHFISSQTQTVDNELWFPICLPTLSQTGFVHGYQCCMGVDVLRLTIISQDPSVDEFVRLRKLADEIKVELGLSQASESMLRIYQLHQSERKGRITDELLLWEKTNDDIIKTEINGSDLDIIEKRKFGYHLLRSMTKAMDEAYQRHMMESYCEIVSATHFVFRYSVPIRNFSSGSVTGGYLSQCYSPSMKFIDDESNKESIWKAYEKLNLRLRIGSDSLQPIYNDFDNNQRHGKDDIGINQYRPSQLLHERTLQGDGLTYFIQENELYLGLSGRNYELYVCFNTITNPSDTHTFGRVLVDTLLSDIHDLLYCKPKSI